MTTTSADRKLLLRCEEIKKESHDPDRKVGVVIANQNGTILAQAANAPPQTLGLSIEESYANIDRDPSWKYFMMEHAERNAIFSALKQGISLNGAILYGSLYPCADCARAIAAAGIKRVVISAADQDPQRDMKWSDHYKYAKGIFTKADIEVCVLNFKKDS